MCARHRKIRSGVIIAVVGIALAAVSLVEAADQGGVDIRFKARAISALGIERATADLVDIRVTRWSTDEERSTLVTTLVNDGNKALAEALSNEAETGWVSFDPRGGGGPGRDPRRATLRYSREIVQENTKEVILITNQYVGYGLNPLAADGSKLAEYPISFVLLKFQKDDNGGWKKGIGRMFVGAKVRFESTSEKFVIDEFPMDPVYLKDVTVK